MCIPTSKKRKEIQQIANDPRQLQSKPPTQVEQTCKQPKLLRLDLQGAEGGRALPWAVVSPHCVFTVLAITEPPDTPVAWVGGQAHASNRAEIARRAAAPSTVVSASLAGVTKSVDVEVVDLVSLRALGQEIDTSDAAAWKTYECSVAAEVGATVSPADPGLASLVQWRVNAVAAGSAAKVGIDRQWPLGKADSSVEMRTVEAVLGTVCPKTLSQQVRVCRWPKLELEEVGFGGFEVLNDGVAEFGKAFDRRWKPGRAHPASNQATASSQSALCLKANSKPQLWARFKVVQKPTDTEKVTVEGKASFGGVDLVWREELTVKPGDATVKTSTLASDKAIANAVAAGKMLKIEWTQSAPPRLYADGSSDAPAKAGSSENLAYVVLKSPAGVAAGKVYWTLLDVSCRGGDGATTEDALVAGAFTPLKSTTGDGKGLPRKGDGVRMSYYLQGTDTGATNDEYSTEGILSSAHGTGRCGGWMRWMLHMLAIHGVTSAAQYACVRWSASGADDMDLRFLVKNCAFPASADPAAAPYRNLGNKLIKNNGVAGQGKTNPQFDFGDHVTVRYGGRIYDPSYGIGPYADEHAYETAAIDGFGEQSGGVYPRTLADGTAQFVSEKVGPDCLYVHTSSAGQTPDAVALQWQMAGGVAALRKLNPVVLNGIGDADVLVVGTQLQVVLPRTGKVLKWS